MQSEIVQVYYGAPYVEKQYSPTGAWQVGGRSWLRPVQRALFVLARWLGARERMDVVSVNEFRVDRNRAKEVLSDNEAWARMKELIGTVGVCPVAILCGPDQYMEFATGDVPSRSFMFELGPGQVDYEGGMRVLRKFGVLIVCVPWMRGCLPIETPLFLRETVG